MSAIKIERNLPGRITNIYRDGRLGLSTVFSTPDALDNVLCIIFSVPK